VSYPVFSLQGNLSLSYGSPPIAFALLVSLDCTPRFFAERRLLLAVRIYRHYRQGYRFGGDGGKFFCPEQLY
jgi:hypothetical protein